jgi:hypothetical protein
MQATGFGFYVHPVGALVCILVYLCFKRLMACQRDQLVIVSGRLCVSECECHLGSIRRSCCSLFWSVVSAVGKTDKYNTFIFSLKKINISM